MKRKLAEHDNLKVTIEQTGDKFHIKEVSTFRTKDIDFTLGVAFDYSLADGTEVSVSVQTWCRLHTRSMFLPCNVKKKKKMQQVGLLCVRGVMGFEANANAESSGKVPVSNYSAVVM